MNNIDVNNYEDGSVQNLNIGRSIDKVSNTDKAKYIESCCKKLAYGGLLQLEFLHLSSFCKNYLFGENIDLNNLLELGSITNPQELTQLLQQNQIKILNISIGNGLCKVEATK